MKTCLTQRFTKSKIYAMSHRVSRMPTGGKEAHRCQRNDKITTVTLNK
jgi:hypothetical protein